ncbi:MULTISPECIES: hypothetical protein [unclassified Sphingobium]|uniref:hypothetical protein n=1 Tax=unclassified Sphingobium TaxID=2611147 RepID=UPI0022248F21|nr:MULTISPECIES: hypothetical protein [unclassified Sphingobium]MCW2366001.1 hypothetical protein [Sphingobium sp. B7D2B]MCW2381405.1 hypothetical protein [Sphingobium sp. B2D3B]MCW2398488.1 hypothetical protein [Sphingobium sp. B2D3C]
MTQPVRLRLHVSEPFDFERHNESADLFGTTRDHGDEDAGEWVIELESRFQFNEQDYDSVLVSPRYVGEPLRRVFDAMLGEPVRIAHRTPEGWHYAMTGMLSVAPPASDGPAGTPDNPTGL